MTRQLKWTVATVSVCLTSLCLGLMKNGSDVNRSHRNAPDVTIVVGQFGKKVVVTAVNNTARPVGLVEVVYDAGGTLRPRTALDSQIVRPDGMMLFKFKHVPARGQQSIAAAYQSETAEATQPQASTVALAAPSLGSALP
jgi:hypothetical protein